MRIIQSANPRPLNLLAVGAGGLVAAASATYGVLGDIEVWDGPAGKLRFLRNVPHGTTQSIAFTPDGRSLHTGEPENETYLIDTTTGIASSGPTARFGHPEFAVASNGTRFLVTSAWNQVSAVECFALEPGLVFRPLWIDGPPLEMVWFEAGAITFDGSRVAFVERGAFSGADGRTAQSLSIRDTDTGKQLVSIPTDAASPVQQLAFTADGAKLLVRTESRTVQMFDATTGAPAGELVHPGRPYVTGIASHPRGPVACARTNGTVTLWDAEKREQLRTLDWKAGKLVSVAFSPDGALGAAGTEDGKVIVWDVDL